MSDVNVSYDSTFVKPKKRVPSVIQETGNSNSSFFVCIVNVYADADANKQQKILKFLERKIKELRKRKIKNFNESCVD